MLPDVAKEKSSDRNCVACSMTRPGVRHLDIRPVEGCNRGTTQQSKGALNVRAQNFQRAGDSRWPPGSQSVSIGAPHQNAARAKAECFHNVTAAANASIHQHLDLAVDRGDDFGERAQRWKN